MPPTLPPTSQAPTLPALSLEDYAFLQSYIQRESGISLGQDKLYLLQNRLLPLVEHQRLHSLAELCQRLRAPHSPDLRRNVVEAMTTHETLFFRDPAVYEALRTVIIPAIARQRQATRTLRIWSAACSSGQEPYSLAILLLEAGFADWNIEILGTDLSTQILGRAAAGNFLQLEVGRGLPAQMLVKYFQRAGMGWLVKGEVRKLVRFTQFDLRNNMQALGPFDLVLCRNVLIYFDLETRRKILSGIRGVLRPGGYFLMGSTETTFNLDDTFLRLPCGAAIAYQNPALPVTK
jgi:chemotaxis protein methyltransferase CheR